MSIEGPRASDADRERALAALRDAVAAGHVSSDTFLLRIDAVLHATTRPAVAAAVADLPHHRGAGDLVLRGIAGTSAFLRNAVRIWRLPWLAALPLPAEPSRPLVIGRAPDCDVVLTHPTISRRHAQLRPRQLGWELVDLGSTNGTRVNGYPQLGTAAHLKAGDIVSFGALSLAVTTAAPRRA
jgi:hypothetical protein